MMLSRAGMLRGFGSLAVRNLKLEKAAPLSAVGPAQVSLAMVASPVHNADRKVGSSSAISGIEGLGKVTSVGTGVSNLKVGDWVVPKLGFGAWRSEAVADAAAVTRVPNDIPASYACSMSTDSATAYRLLRDFGVKKGDWIIQSDAASPVGLAVIQMARDMGVRTINVIDSRTPNQETVLRLLTNLGGDLNCTDLYVYAHGMNDIVQGQNVALAIAGSSGDVATNMSRMLSTNGVLVTLDAADAKAVAVPPEKKVKVTSFSIAEWYGKCSDVEKATMFSDIASAIRQKQLTLFFQEHDFDDFAHALKEAAQPWQLRKVVLRMDHPDRLREHDALPTSAYEQFETTYA